MHRVRWFTSAALLLLVAACEKAPPVTSTLPTAAGDPRPAAAVAPAASTAPAASALERTRWSLVESRLSVPPPEDANRIRLEFRDGRLAANSGCNQGTGGYTLEADSLVLEQMATTRRACIGAAGEYEPAFFALLTSRPTVTRGADGTELVLAAGSGASGTLKFRSEPMPGVNAVQRFVYVAAERVPCTGVAPMQCLQVRDDPSQPWRPYYGEIIGFTHEPGIEYRLRILEDDVPNPPADASSKRWFLDLVVEQKVVKR